MSEIPEPSAEARFLAHEREERAMFLQAIKAAIGLGHTDANETETRNTVEQMVTWKARAAAFLDNVHAHAAGEVCTPDTCALAALLREE